jgi:predicted DNA-binding protein (MmcQ/YjbR family)
MTIDTVRTICRALPGVTEDIKWGHDLCFSVGGKMFAAMDVDPPHSIGFKCTPETFAELVERPGVIPAPYMARNMWVLEQRLGDALTRRELEALLRTSYELVVAKLPKSRQPGAAAPARGAKTRARSAGAGGARRSRTGPAASRRRGR